MSYMRECVRLTVLSPNWITHIYVIHTGASILAKVRPETCRQKEVCIRNKKYLQKFDN